MVPKPSFVLIGLPNASNEEIGEASRIVKAVSRHGPRGEYDSTTLAAVCILLYLECLVDVIIDRIVACVVALIDGFGW